MAISASQVKELREATGAGMLDCKKALMETDGNFDEAAKLLKEKGLAAVAKRSERATSEGHIFIRQRKGFFRNKGISLAYPQLSEIRFYTSLSRRP